MNAVEDRLRAAMRATAATVPDDGAPPLSPPDEAPSPAIRRRRPRRNMTWIAPLAAAAAVIALVAGLAVAHNSSGDQQAGLASPAPALPDGLPAYILAARQAPPLATQAVFQYGPSSVRHETIDIIATASGRTAQTATLPGLVLRVVADNSGRFYAAVLMRTGPVRLYEIRRRASGSVAAVTMLPIRATRALISNLAVSPDGSRLAMTTYRVDYQGTRPALATTSLVVAVIASGAERRWTPPQAGEHGLVNGITWLSDNQTLALTWWPTSEIPTKNASLRFVNTAAPGSSLPAGHSVLSLINPAGKFPLFAISGNGRVLVGATLVYGAAGRVQGRRAIEGSLVRFAEPGGRPSFLYRPSDQGRAAPGLCQPPAWISPSGQKVLAGCFLSGKAPIHLVLLSKGHATVLLQLTRLFRQQSLIAIGG